MRKLEAIGGVESVGVTSEVTMGGNNNNDPIWVEDFPQQDAGIPPLRRHKYIADGYFTTMGNPVIAGRGLTWNDVAHVAKVALVSENLAREYWGEPAKALGKRIRRSTKSPWYEIVGVVGNERQDGATQAVADDRLLADAERRRSGSEGHLHPALAGLRDPLVAAAVAGVPRRSAAGGVERQSQPAARARPDACSRSTTSRWRKRSSCW